MKDSSRLYCISMGIKNNTNLFIDLINKVLNENKAFFESLKNINLENEKELIIKIFEDSELDLNIYKEYCGEISYLLLKKPYQEHIKEFIFSFKNEFFMDLQTLKDISKQIEINYLLKIYSKETAKFYFSISHALIYYGIYQNGNIVPFTNTIFWKNLIKKIYLLNLMHNSNFNLCCEGYPEHPDFNFLHRLIDNKNIVEQQLKEKLEIIDGVVFFKKGQEDRIVQKIENKLVQIDLYSFIEIIFALYRENKKSNNLEYTMPYKYIINILIKNIFKSKHKNKDIKKIINIKNLLSSFIGLYQLKEDKFTLINISPTRLLKHLNKQVLYTKFYPIYELKTSVLIEYMKNIVKPSIDENLFLEEFGFTLENLIEFFIFIDKHNTDIIKIEKNNLLIFNLKILEFYSIDSNIVNTNYSSLNSLEQTTNLVAMNPIVKHKNIYLIIGFKYFKMNFYNSLVERVRQKIDKDINSKIGINSEKLLINIFERIKNKHNYKIFSGNYTPPKQENPESDLTLKLEKDIVFFESKNKYLTAKAFKGSDSDILKDLTLSFIHSQLQLFRHEKNIRKYKKIIFNDKEELKYNNENIVKISVSTNNWFNIMNNLTKTMLLEMINLRFKVKEEKSDFSKANEYLDKLQKIIIELSKDKDFNIEVSLNQTLFLPLELIAEKYKDDNFIDILKTLVQTSMNVDNILHIYDYIKYIKSYKE